MDCVSDSDGSQSSPNVGVVEFSCCQDRCGVKDCGGEFSFSVEEIDALLPTKSGERAANRVNKSLFSDRVRWM